MFVLRQLGLLLFLSFFMAGSSLAVTPAEFAETGLLEAGAILFGFGVLLLFIPKFTKTGIILTLLGNLAVVSRILFQPEIIKYVEGHGIGQFIENLSRDDLRLYFGIITVVLAAVLFFIGVLKTFLWRSFWHLFGFYKTPEEKDAEIENRKRRIEQKINRGEMDSIGQKSESPAPTMKETAAAAVSSAVAMASTAADETVVADENAAGREAVERENIAVNEEARNQARLNEDVFAYDHDISFDLDKVGSIVLDSEDERLR